MTKFHQCLPLAGEGAEQSEADEVAMRLLLLSLVRHSHTILRRLFGVYLTIFLAPLEMLYEPIEQQNKRKAGEKGVGSAVFGSVCVSVGDDFIADDIQHRTARKGECKGEDK